MTQHEIRSPPMILLDYPVVLENDVSDDMGCREPNVST